MVETTTLDDVVAIARRLSPRDRLRLIERLAADLGPALPPDPPPTEAAPADPPPAESAPADPPPDKKAPRPSLYGLWAGLGIDLSEEEIRELRREAWSGLGRREI